MGMGAWRVVFLGVVRMEGLGVRGLGRTYNFGSERRGGKIRGWGWGIRVPAVGGRDGGAHVARESRWANVLKIVSVCMFFFF